MKKEKIVILRDTDKMIRWIEWAVDYLENCIHMGEEGQGLLNDGRDILVHRREKKKAEP